MNRAVLLVLLVLTFACEEPVFREAQVLAGASVPAAVLEQGRHVYRRYCQTCHGAKGDGQGPSAHGQWPPPRDFRSAHFKFAGIQDRGLPSDEELERVILHGLAGTGMRGWLLQERELHAVVQYIKTFSYDGKGFRSERLKVKAPVIAEDPYQDQEQIADAIVLGRELYHGSFQCSSCHPAYVDVAQLQAWQAALRPLAPFDSVPKWSENYNTVLLPPDFLRHPMRSVAGSAGHVGQLDHDVRDIYRSVAFGLQGPMPGFVHLGEDKVWAVAHYVKSLADQRQGQEARALRAALLAAPDVSPPAPAPADASAADASDEAVPNAEQPSASTPASSAPDPLQSAP